MTRARRVAKRLALAGTGAALLGAMALCLAVLCVDYDVSRLEPGEATSLRVLDRHGHLLRHVPLSNGGRAQWVALADVAPAVVSATVASEDHRFFDHGGVDPLGLARAAWLNLRALGMRYGGSTLTMQLIRLVEPRPRTLRSKLIEALEAMRLERAIDKDTILEQYLSRAYYGAGAFGIQQAARRYFGKPAAALSLSEASLLAALPRAPQAYNPLRHRKRALSRRAHVLALMEQRGLITADERRRAQEQPLRFARWAPPGEARHFVDWALTQLPARERERGGDVKSTLDLRLQRRLERAVQEHVISLEKGGQSEAGVVVVDPRTGAVRAMVGSPDPADPEHGWVNITTTPRHPGSALKPFVYALALEQGDTPATIAWGVLGAPSKLRPHGKVREHGPARYREALASSFNLAAVHTLERVGVGRLLASLREAGLGPLQGSAKDYGHALAVGSGKVRLVDLAAAFGFLVNEGIVRPAYALDHAAVRRPTPRRLYSPQVSWLVMDMLADPDARRGVFGAHLPLDLPFAVAAKTGTSAGFSDTVTVGATREAIAAAWVAPFDGSGTRGRLAMWSAAPLVRAALLAAGDGRALTLPDPPGGIETRPVCRLSGQEPRPFCPVHREHFVEGTAPRQPCTWHRLDQAGRLHVEYPKVLRGWASRRRGAGGALASK